MNTNNRWLAEDVGLPDNVVLWTLYHPQRHDINHAREKCDAWAQAKKIILLDQEGWFDGPEFEHDSRIMLYDSVVVDHPQIQSWMYWFREVAHVDRFTKLSSECTHWHNKNCNYLFDSLLGTMWPNKSFVQQKIDQSAFKDCFLQGTKQPHYLQIDNDWVGGGGYSTATGRLDYRPGQQTDIAVFVPSKIYNNSWYSIVAEAHRPRIYFTEKTAKPMIAKRLFVLFGHQHTLKALKELGFKTFDSWWDEGYDEDPWDFKHLALRHNVDFIDQQSQSTIQQWYNEMTPILDHNYNVFLELTQKQISTTDFYNGKTI